MRFGKEVIEIIPSKKIFTGAKNAAITLVEFGDYESEACAIANEAVKQLLENYPTDIKFIFRHFPLLKIHQKAHKAAEASIGASQEGKFWPMHNILFANRRNLGAISLKGYAREAGVTAKKFLDDLLGGTYGIYVQDDLKEGIKLGITDVPLFFINGKRFDKEPTYKNLHAQVQELLGKKKAKTKELNAAA